MLNKKEKMHSKVYIYTDGASRGNPGKAAIAFLIFDENKKLLEKNSKYIGKTTNNVAEYKAIIKSLEKAIKYTKNKIEIFSDSELVVRQINGLYKIKAKHLKPLFLEIKEKEKNFQSVVYKNVPRENKNIQKADILVNEELDKIR